MPPRRARSSSRAAPPNPSTSWRSPTRARACSAATRSCSPRSNITPTSCPGSWWPGRPAPSSRPCPWTGAVSSTWPTVAAHMNERTRIVACAHVSNALGTVLPVREITRLAHARGAVVLIDGAQAVPHQRVDLQSARLRLLRVLGAQDVRPHRHRRAHRSRVAARGHAAVAGRRRHDPHRELREDHVQRAAVQVRSRHAQHLRRGRAWRRPSTTSTPLGIDNIHAHEQRLLAARHAQTRSAFRASPSSAPRPTRPR